MRFLLFKKATDGCYSRACGNMYFIIHLVWELVKCH